MKSILVFTCCLALAMAAQNAGADQHKNKNKKDAGQQQQGQQQQQHAGKQGKHAMGTSNAQQLHTNQKLKTNSQLRMGGGGGKNSQAMQGNKHVNKTVNVNKKVVKNFNVKNVNINKYEKVTFKANAHIIGSEKWVGPKYVVFRNYKCEWHDHDWWHSHHSRIVVVFGAPYFWDAGYWYPAWGYDPGAAYVYDGPIRAYADLPPDQVIANVQSALQEQGYYQGEIDGLLGPQTRAALAQYQSDNGLYATSAIDEPTLESLGFA